MRTGLTATELLFLRCPIQWTRLYVAIHRPQTLFSARLASVPASFPAASFAWNSGTPTSGTVPAGATVWIGSTAGARDKGWVRLRTTFTKAATGTMNIAEIGEKLFNLASNDYLTVVEDYRPAARFPRYNAGWFMDYDVAYDSSVSKQNDNYGPLARLGPAAVGFIVGGQCKLKYVGERSAAYSPGNSISAWTWAFPDSSSSSSQGTTASPVVVNYTTAIKDGQYHSLTVTESVTTKTHTGRRLTFVFERTGSNAPYDAVIVGSITGGPQQGGYTANLRIVNTTASETDFPPQAHVVIFEEAFYADEAGQYFVTDEVSGSIVVTDVVTGSTSGAVGTVVAIGSGYIQIAVTAGEFVYGEAITKSGASARIYAPNVGGNYPYRTNIVLEGWIVAETTRKNPETGEIEFTVATQDGILKTIEGYPVALTNRSTTPTLDWESYKRLTMNTAVIHFVLWRSTLADICDVEFQAYGPPFTDIMKYLNMDKASLFDQLNQFWQRSILGWVSFDLQGALYCEMDAVIDETIRSNLPTIWTVNKDIDLRDDLEIQRPIIDLNSQTILYAVAYRKPLGSKSPGDPHGYEGATIEITEGLVGPLVGGAIGSPDGATLRAWNGNLRAKHNNDYPAITHRLAGNWRIDPTPQCRFVESFVSGDTLRGFALTSQYFIPRDLKLNFQAAGFALLSDLTADAETTGIGGASITFPPVEDPPMPTDPPPVPPVEPPGVLADAKEVWLGVIPGSGGSGGGVAWAGDYFSTLDSQPGWNLVLDPPTGVTPLDWFGITNNGQAYWIANQTKIYYCATPKTGSWTLIAEAGTDLGGNIVHAAPRFTPAVIARNTLIVGARKATGNYDWLYASYDGSVWTSNVVFETNLFELPLVGLDTIGRNDTNKILTGAGVELVDYNNAWGIGYEAWHRASGARYYTVLHDSHLYLYTVAGEVLDLGVLVFSAEQPRTKIRGAEASVQVYAVSACDATEGNVLLSDDGSSFSTIATWLPAWIADARYTGGGMLVLAALTPGASSVPTRLYERDGTAHDKTGNYYTEIFPDIANGVIIGMGLVY